VDRRRVFRRLTIAGIVVFTLIVVAAFVRQGWITSQARKSVERSYEVREQIRRVFAKVKDVELGQRGYVLSGDSAYLEPYFEALHGVPFEDSLHDSDVRTLWDEVDILRSVLGTSRHGAIYVDSLEVLVRRRAEIAERVIRIRSLEGQDAAITVVKRGEGKRVMNDTRNLVATMLADEERQLERLRDAESASLRANTWLLYTVVGLFYVAWLFSLLLASRNRHRRLAAESSLRESHNLLQATIHSGSHAIFSTDLDGTILLFNAAAERMLGIHAMDVIGKKASVVLRDIHDRDQIERRRKRLEARLGRPVQGMEIFTVPSRVGEASDPEWTLIRKDGERFLASMVVSPMEGRDGRQYGYLTIVRDVTERRMMERRLVESNALFNSVIDGTHYAIFASDMQGRVTVFNRAAERMLGMKAADVIGKSSVALMQGGLLPGEIEARAKKIQERYGRPPEGIELFTLPLDGDDVYGQEWTLVNKQGRPIPIAMSVSLILDTTGKAIGSVALARDITDLKANERMKNEFISTVSHELRTPLTSIRGALGLITGGATGKLPEKAAELVSIAYRNSERLVHIINDILDIEKIDSGRLSIQILATDAADILRQAVEVNRSYGDKYNVSFVLKEVTQDLHVMADPDRLMQVLANLMSNAAKFSPAGAEVWLGVQARGLSVRFTVRDFGAGIPEEFRTRMFEKFAQAEGNDTRSREGTGLGLNITKKLVEAMGGTISFETETGKGTFFNVDLPLGAVPVSGVVRDAVGGGAGNDDAAETRQRPRVLICEDDPDVGTLLRLLLEKAGLAAEVVHTLEAARTRLAAKKYAALTLDLMLPDGSGLALLRALRRDAASRDLPVIVISARAEEGRREFKGDAIGVIDWMTKPIDEKRLAASLRRVITRSGEGGATDSDRPRVLHVEDDFDFSCVLAKSLGDSAELVGAATLATAESLLARERFDLVVLDIDLPDGSGLELLERLKSHPGGPVPVLILSASETDNGIRQKVEAAMVKSRLSEERIVDTILEQIRKASRTQGVTPS
jgi:PAS domain S-box-containing protein